MSDTQTADRFLTVAKFVDETGYSDSAVRNKISKGVWLDVWEKLSERDLEFSTLHVYKRHMAAYWTPVFGQVLPRDITHESNRNRNAINTALAAPVLKEGTNETY